LPNIFENIAPEDHFVNTCETPGRIGEEHISCSLINNTGQMILGILLIIVIKLLEYLYERIQKKKSKKMNNTHQIDKKNEELTKNNNKDKPNKIKNCLCKFREIIFSNLKIPKIIIIMRMTMVDLLMPVFVNYYFLNQFSIIMLINWILAIIITIWYILLILIGISLIYKSNYIKNLKTK